MSWSHYYNLIKNQDKNPVNWQQAKLANPNTPIDALRLAFLKMLEEKDVVALENLIQILMHFANQLELKSAFEAFGQDVYEWMRNDPDILNKEYSVDLFAMAKKRGLMRSAPVQSNINGKTVFADPGEEIPVFNY